MRKIFIITAALLLLVAPLYGADTQTPNLGLTKPDAPAGSWGDKINQNFDILDGAVKSGAGTGDAQTADPLSQFAPTSSSQLKDVLSDETGTGAAVFGTGPTLIGPHLGTPASGDASNLINLPLTTGTTGTLPANKGGTGQTTINQGDILFGAGGSLWNRLAKDPNVTRYLSNTGTSNNPAWSQIDLTSGVTGLLPLAQGGTSQTYAAIVPFTGAVVTGSCQGPNQIWIKTEDGHIYHCPNGGESTPVSTRQGIDPFVFAVNVVETAASVTATGTVDVNVQASLVSGSPEVITWSVLSGLPANVTAAFVPTTCTANCSSVLRLTTTAATAGGPFTITVRGTAVNTTTQDDTFALTVTAGTPPAFIENLAKQTLANTLPYCWYDGCTEQLTNMPVCGDNKCFTAWLNGDNTSADEPHEVVVSKYDYATGDRTNSANIGSLDSGNDLHNSPNLHMDSSGYLWLFYGSLAGPLVDKAGGPYYRKSTNPYDITAWDAQAVLAWPGGGNRFGGGFTTNDSLHMIGDHNYARRTSAGTWTIKEGLIENPGYTTCGQPLVDATVKGANFLFAWRSENGSGAGRGLYFAFTDDNGDTFKNAAGTTSVTRAAGFPQAGTVADGLFPCGFYRTWSSAFLVQSGRIDQMRAGQMNDGTKFVIYYDGGSLLMRKWTGSAWTLMTTISSTRYATNFDVSVMPTSGKIVVTYVDNNNYNIYERVSADGGTTWAAEVLLYTKGAENQNLYLSCTPWEPAGQDPRVVCHWSQRLNITSSVPTRHSEVGYIDRKIP